MSKVKAVRMLAVSAAAALSVGIAGASVASASPEPMPHANSGMTLVRPTPGPVGSGGAASSDGYLSYGEVASVTVNGLRVRSGPGTGSGVWGQLYRGDRVRLIGAGQDGRGQIWNRVTVTRSTPGGLPRGFVGWVSQAYLY